jgi:hypothetical protein
MLTKGSVDEVMRRTRKTNNQQPAATSQQLAILLFVSPAHLFHEVCLVFGGQVVVPPLTEDRLEADRQAQADKDRRKKDKISES